MADGVLGPKGALRGIRQKSPCLLRVSPSLWLVLPHPASVLLYDWEVSFTPPQTLGPIATVIRVGLSP